MLTATQTQRLRDWLTEACEGVGESFFRSARPASLRHQAQFENLAVIGFSGDELRGSLGITADWRVLRAFLARFHPEDAITDTMMLDTLGEIANQLLGRLKNTLTSNGVTVSMTTPMVVRGLRLSVAGASQDLFLRHDLDTDDGLISVWVDMKVTGALTFEALAPEEQSSSEGEMMLFF